jgi:chromosome partitioning protein
MNAIGTIQKPTHIVVVGNEKGGSGKSTTTMHVVTSLLTDGLRVATIDLDSRQKSLTRYIENRKRFAQKSKIDLPLPQHHVIDRAQGDSIARNSWGEYEAFGQLLGDLEGKVDFVVVDTPGSDTALSRMCHSAADTLITPMNDSFVDLDVLADVDPVTNEVLRASHYADVVSDARRERRAVDNVATDWIVLRNRLASLESRNRRTLGSILERLSLRLGFRLAAGLGERVIYRELFPLGLTAMDPLETIALGGRTSMSHLAARQEVRALMATLRLPVDDRSKRRRDAKALWSLASSMPLDMPEIGG